MNKLYAWLLPVLLASSAAAPADTVIEELPDNLPGSSLGGLSGFMVGAAAGGPLGAVAGAGIGWLLGAGTQEAAGLSGTAYRVARDTGDKVVIRSPKRSWSPGGRVRVVNGRLVEERSTGQTPPIVTLTTRP